MVFGKQINFLFSKMHSGIQEIYAFETLLIFKMKQDQELQNHHPGSNTKDPGVDQGSRFHRLTAE